MVQQLPCPLCATGSSEFLKDYFQCPNCDLRFLDPRFRLNTKDEKARYDLHNNSFDDPNYRKFLKPLADTIRPELTPGAVGLDFGAGPAPVLADILNEMGFSTFAYDPFFHNDRALLERQYDFICASEVAEHFYDPRQEFQRLRSMLKPNGVLGVMTSLYTTQIDFASWYYRKDPTHVLFFSQKTCIWIASHFNFKAPFFKNDRIVILPT